MKSEILKNAWKIARKAQGNYGYSVRDYLSESMKIAWGQAKNGEIEMELKKMSVEELQQLITDAKKEIEEKTTENKVVTVELLPGTASGRRESWFKLVESVDSSQKGGYAYNGEFLKSRIELELKVGSIILECSPHGSVKNGWKEGELYRVKSDGTLEELVKGFDWQKEAVSFRKEVEKYF